jgi:hypothetical protein
MMDIFNKRKEHNLYFDNLLLGTFTVYVLIDSENVLTAEKAFVATSLFGILSWTLNVIPHIVNRFVQVSRC